MDGRSLVLPRMWGFYLTIVKIGKPGKLTKTGFDLPTQEFQPPDKYVQTYFNPKRKYVELTVATASGGNATLRLNLLYDLQTRHGSPFQTIIPRDGP